MAVTATPALVQTPKITPITIVPADTTAKKTACTAGTNGTKVVSLTAASDDTAAVNVQIWLTRSATSYLIGTVNVPITSGNTGAIASVNLLAPSLIPGLPVDNDGQPYLFLVSGDTLSVSALATVTTAKTVYVTCVSGDF